MVNSSKLTILLFGFIFASFACTHPTSPKTMPPPPATKPTLYYVFDALCGWCYGFSPVMQQVLAGYKDRLDFEVISGGMVTGNRIGPIGQVAPYIKNAYKDVERATGTQFGKAFITGTLEKGTAQFSSIEPAWAIATVRNHNPANALGFAHDVQHAIYFDGVGPTDLEALALYAEKYGLNKAAFLQQVHSPQIKEQALKEFRTSDSLKVTGFPTLFILKNGKLTKLVEGYLPLEELEKRITQVLNSK